MKKLDNIYDKPTSPHPKKCRCKTCIAPSHRLLPNKCTPILIPPFTITCSSGSFKTEDLATPLSEAIRDKTIQEAICNIDKTKYRDYSIEGSSEIIENYLASVESEILISKGEPIDIVQINNKYKGLLSPGYYVLTKKH